MRRTLNFVLFKSCIEVLLEEGLKVSQDCCQFLPTNIRMIAGGWGVNHLGRQPRLKTSMFAAMNMPRPCMWNMDTARPHPFINMCRNQQKHSTVLYFPLSIVGGPWGKKGENLLGKPP